MSEQNVQTSAKAVDFTVKGMKNYIEKMSLGSELQTEWGDYMKESGLEFDGEFGEALLKLGEGLKSMSTLQRAFMTNIDQNFIEEAPVVLNFHVDAKKANLTSKEIEGYNSAKQMQHCKLMYRLFKSMYHFYAEGYTLTYHLKEAMQKLAEKGKANSDNIKEYGRELRKQRKEGYSYSTNAASSGSSSTGSGESIQSLERDSSFMSYGSSTSQQQQQPYTNNTYSSSSSMSAHSTTTNNGYKPTPSTSTTNSNSSSNGKGYTTSSNHNNNGFKPKRAPPVPNKSWYQQNEGSNDSNSSHGHGGNSYSSPTGQSSSSTTTTAYNKPPQLPVVGFHTKPTPTPSRRDEQDLNNSSSTEPYSEDNSEESNVSSHRTYQQQFSYVTPPQPQQKTVHDTKPPKPVIPQTMQQQTSRKPQYPPQIYERQNYEENDEYNDHNAHDEEYYNTNEQPQQQHYITPKTQTYSSQKPPVPQAQSFKGGSASAVSKQNGDEQQNSRKPQTSQISRPPPPPVDEEYEEEEESYVEQETIQQHVQKPTRVSPPTPTNPSKPPVPHSHSVRKPQTPHEYEEESVVHESDEDEEEYQPRANLKQMLENQFNRSQPLPTSQKPQHVVPPSQQPPSRVIQSSSYQESNHSEESPSSITTGTSRKPPVPQSQTFRKPAQQPSSQSRIAQENVRQQNDYNQPSNPETNEEYDEQNYSHIQKPRKVSPPTPTNNSSRSEPSKTYQKPPMPQTWRGSPSTQTPTSPSQEYQPSKPQTQSFQTKPHSASFRRQQPSTPEEDSNNNQQESMSYVKPTVAVGGSSSVNKVVGNSSPQVMQLAQMFAQSGIFAPKLPNQMNSNNMQSSPRTNEQYNRMDYGDNNGGVISEPQLYSNVESHNDSQPSFRRKAPPLPTTRKQNY